MCRVIQRTNLHFQKLQKKNALRVCSKKNFTVQMIILYDRTQLVSFVL